MANELRGEVTVKLLDGEHTLKYTFNAFAALRFRFGTEFLLELVDNAGKGLVRCKDWQVLRYFLWAGLLEECETRRVTLTEMQVGALIPVEGVPEIFRAVLHGLNKAYGGDETKNAGRAGEVEGRREEANAAPTSKRAKHSRLAS